MLPLLDAISRIEMLALPGLPLVKPGDDLAGLLISGLLDLGIALTDGDVLVVAQKVVSKAEGQLRDLRSIEPSRAARDLAVEVDKDPRLVELILSESRAVLRKKPGLLITEHRRGWIMANAGVDQSNLGGGNEQALLLPRDPDASAEAIRARVLARFDVPVAVVIGDSFGRPWRLGTVGVALGAAGLPALVDRRGEVDLFGRELKATIIGFADQIASAAALVMGEAGESQPAVLLRGLTWSAPDDNAASLVRPADEDLFR